MSHRARTARWQISIEPVSPARGRLVIFDTLKSLRFVISGEVERGHIPVSWAPDSSVLVYSLGGTLYFARPEAFFSPSLVDAKYRILGPGTISCIGWYSSSRILYASGSTVYRIPSSELFARSLYTPLIGVGEMAGKLPCPFNPGKDSFCASPDGSAVLFAADSRNVYYCPLSGDDYVSGAAASLLPYLLLPGNTAGVSLVWTAEGIPAVIAEAVEDGKKQLKAWKLEEIAAGRIFSPLDLPPAASAAILSPGGTRMAFIIPQGLLVRSTSTWNEVASWKDEPVVSVAWSDEAVLYVGGKSTVRIWDSGSGNSSLVTVSSVSACGWDEKGTAVLGDTPGLGRYSWASPLQWSPASSARFRPASSSNPNWRLYLDSGDGYYANMLFARSATSPGGTKKLIKEPSIRLDSLLPVPGKNTAGESDLFSHGSRSGFRQVALVFDAMDSLEGLPEILAVLDRYRIRATFFINGEFIRQHPAAVNEIVKAGHQCASLFFTTWDLSGTGYRIDEDFIIRGLSRNEDDFYNATGQELTLMWHAPYYVVSPMILKAGQKAGYRYVSGDVTVLDWVTAEQERVMPGLYRPAATLIENIMETKKPGSIIPVRIGTSGERSDYLFEKTDLLINALIEAGYSIVTVDTLISNAR